MGPIDQETRAALRQVADKQAIANCLAMHSRGVDRADANLLGSTYHPEAEEAYGIRPASQFVAFVTQMQKGLPSTLHRTNQMWIRVEGDTARAESYVTAYVETPGEGGNTQRLIGGRYLDHLVRHEGEWRIARRIYVMDWNMNWPSTAQWPDPPVSMAHFVPRGGHGAADAGRALLTQAAARMTDKGGKAMSAHEIDVDIDALLSKQAIQELIMAYARGVDRADKELLASIFHDDAVVVSGVINGSGKEFAEGICDYVQANLQRCFHSVANVWIEVKGDRAVGESYVIATSTVGDKETFTGGRYIDSYERRNGVWKISSRTFVLDWTSAGPSTYESGGFYEGLTNLGCFGKEDPVYRFWG
ncbi:nuclear transport factor 2 family protein [Pedomonas sp. V897]|uniref:nuclear transport factor 2 family protein n=1 Tax=Pedomonas sp. V897 TaxID=3446482 RepID=UPI003EE3A909